MSRTFKQSFRSPVATAIILAVASLGDAAVEPVNAQTASIVGTWNGGGRVVLPSGDSERVRCRATFRQVTTRTFRMSAVCATQATRIVQVAQVRRISTSSYTGQFVNREHDITGSIDVTVRGNRLMASLSGGGGRAIMTLSK